MAKKKKYNGRSRKMTIPMAVALPVAATALDVGSRLIQAYVITPNAGEQNALIEKVTGWNGATRTWNTNQIIGTYAPMAVGAVIHKAANYFGVNRMLAQAKLPLFRV